MGKNIGASLLFIPLYSLVFEKLERGTPLYLFRCTRGLGAGSFASRVITIGIDRLYNKDDGFPVILS